MRKYIFIILTLVCVLGNKSYAQELTSAEKEEIIAELDSTDFWVRSGALEKIKQYNITEAIPKLLENIWKEELPSIKYAYLFNLYKLNYDNFDKVAHDFIDSTNTFNFEYSTFNPLIYKMLATDLLIQNGDYTTVNYLFEAFRKDTTTFKTVNYINGFKNVAKHFPEYKDSAIVNLMKIASREIKNDLDKKYKFMALYSLNEIEGINIDSITVELLGKSETEFTIKMLMLKILSDRNYTGLEDLIKERIKSDTSNLFRVALVMKLTEKYSNPSTLSFLKNLSFVESDNRMKKMLKIKTTIFKPTIPDSKTSTTIMLDTLISYTNQCYGYEWLKDEAYKAELLNKITNAKTKLNTGDSLGCRTEIAAFQNSVNQVYQDSAGNYPKYVSSEGYKFLYYYAGYILDRLPKPAEGLPVKLEDSQGNLLQGSSLQYYDGGWQDATDNGDGTFTVQTEKSTVSLKMHYAGGYQQKDNVTVGPDTAVFQTVNTTVKLLNSQGAATDTGTVKYYAGGWKDLGTTNNGIAAKELLPKKYTFQMSYAGGSINKDQDISQNPVVVFQTVNAEVQLKDSQGNLLDGGTVKYYASGWKDFGTAANGSVTKELLPKQYTFQMSYAGITNNKDQDVSANSTVIFTTVHTTVKVTDSNNQPIDGAEVSYYGSGWKTIGTTVNGEVTKELLPKQITFKAKYNSKQAQKDQDIGTNNLVEITIE